MPPKKKVKCTGKAKTTASAKRAGCITGAMKSKLPEAMLLGLLAFRKRQADARQAGVPLVRKPKKEPKPVFFGPMPEPKPKRKYVRKPKVVAEPVFFGPEPKPKRKYVRKPKVVAEPVFFGPEPRPKRKYVRKMPLVPRAPGAPPRRYVRKNQRIDGRLLLEN